MLVLHMKLAVDIAIHRNQMFGIENILLLRKDRNKGRRAASQISML